MTTTSARGGLGATPAQTYGYISDVLGQLADLARGCGDHKLESALRLLALEAAMNGDAAVEPVDPPERPT